LTVPAQPRRADDAFGHSGLFMVPLHRPQAIPGAARTARPQAMRPGGGRAAPGKRHRSRLHRNCLGCARETEHIVSAGDGRGSIPPIRWPAAEPASGTTICLECGQWRAKSFRPSPPAWSEWPRTPIASQGLADTVATADVADDSVSETAAENEGMPPKRDPLQRRLVWHGEGRNRTGDTTVFSRVLYQLSYLAWTGQCSREGSLVS
jgi:hypothetical protein